MTFCGATLPGIPSMNRPLPALSLIETRVLGVLFEKRHTVPDAYPLTLNALISGCNQKTSRSPVMDAADAQVQEALDTLRGMSLVIESSGGRVARYEHNLERVLQIPQQSASILAVLMLRGPQTAGELRIGCDRLHRFSDTSSVEAFLAELATRPAGPLVVELPRAPGARENRWAHLHSGAPVQEALIETHPDGDVSPREVASLRSSVDRLEAEVAALKALLGRVCAELGIRVE